MTDDQMVKNRILIRFFHHLFFLMVSYDRRIRELHSLQFDRI